MATAEKFIIIPYQLKRGKMSPGEMRQASNAVSAEKIAGSMASRFAAVAACAVQVDDESGDMSSPRIVAAHGPVLQLEAA